ncbi:hypothetical protein ROG8370_00870 [Roseovarius gaetbuli]|uniref:Uncharacterized protein n=1 Tax=Roseovarius gaetbuli TaxID=1356575 RepID=A0A1X6YLD3_9RHOB|nr:hypothetical protein [Roseovarius gaetbuli]SLN24235.1 hypothetical protein ROG8370_00870 [Roseovarius gaetbuli]
MDIIITGILGALAVLGLQTEATPLWIDWLFVGFVVALVLARATLANDKWCADLRARLDAKCTLRPYRALMIPL